MYLSIQGIPAFRDFTIRDPLYFVILFQWKLAKKVDFRKFLKVRFWKYGFESTVFDSKVFVSTVSKNCTD